MLLNLDDRGILAADLRSLLIQLQVNELGARIDEFHPPWLEK